MEPPRFFEPAGAHETQENSSEEVVKPRKKYSRHTAINNLNNDLEDIIQQDEDIQNHETIFNGD